MARRPRVTAARPLTASLPRVKRRPPKPRAKARLLYSRSPMPKMKTHSGAKKRFKVTATGKVRGRSAFSTHILEKKSAKRKRRFGMPAEIAKVDEKRVKTLLGAPHRSGRRGR